MHRATAKWLTATFTLREDARTRFLSVSGLLHPRDGHGILSPIFVEGLCITL